MLQLLRNPPLVAVLLASFVACGGSDDSPTEPSDTGVMSIDGTWTYHAYHLNGTLTIGDPYDRLEVLCEIRGASITFEQTGATFAGSTTGGTLECRGEGRLFTTPLGDRTIYQGEIEGETISFVLDHDNWDHWAGLSGSSLRGNTFMLDDFGDYIVRVRGDWTAVR